MTIVMLIAWADKTTHFLLVRMMTCFWGRKTY